jgi:hypothetical protein
MRRFALALALSALALGMLAAPAAAKCPTCLDGVSVQTPDGKPWSDGKPVTLVVSARRGAPGTEFPTTGLAVVMRTDGDRTKCLDAAYDGKLSLGDQTFDISFDVRTLVATTPVASMPDLPVGSTEEAYGFALSDAIGVAPMLGLAALFWLGVAWFINRRTPRRTALAS